MASSNELYEQIEAAFEDFQENHKKFINKGTKAAGGRARKAIGEIKKWLQLIDKLQYPNQNHRSIIWQNKNQQEQNNHYSLVK